MRQRTDLLQHELKRFLCHCGEDLLWQHIMREGADLLQWCLLPAPSSLWEERTVSGLECVGASRSRNATSLLTSAMKVQKLKTPVSIDSVHDGCAYELSVTRLVQTNLFLKLGRLDELFIKVPSERGFGDYRKFVKLAQPNPEDIRPLEQAERFETRELMLKSFSGLKQLTEVSVEVAHYLLIHKLQYERLQNQTSVVIPRARFGVLRSTRMGIFQGFEPTLFQEWVRGTTLWSMFDFELKQVRSQWRPFLPTISAGLSKLLDSGLRNHVDWNIQNFIFNETEKRLFYVDLKPTTFVAKHSNEQNLAGIREYFIV